ncbi:MAG TPA: glycosyltransferase family 39 protein [Gemmatimonadaceae bacterium]|nr:glycosyltransferase family 39 protein [Gemmatimonadaceae bacterium]
MPTLIAATAIAVGIALRVVEFTRNRPLWLDEAMLSLNIAARSFVQLARPLDYDQSAPLAYLWIERLAVNVGGVSERSLRALPFVAGLALVPLVWLVARRLAGATTAALAAVLAALSLSLITFSAEAKQYGVDPLVTAAIAWFAVRVANVPGDHRRWLRLVAVGVAGLLLSQPAIFALGGAAVALALHPAVRRDATARRYAALGVVVWGLVFGALYLAVYSATEHNAYMRSFWEGTFLDPRASDIVQRVRLFAIATYTAPTLTGQTAGLEWAMATTWAAGLWTLWRRRRFTAVMVAAPLFLAALACAVGRYAVMDRLFLFAAPLTLIAYASLLAWVVELVPRRAVVATLVAASVALALTAAPTLVRRISHPVFYAVGKDVIAQVDALSYEREPVYIAARTFPLWVFYTTDWTAPDEARLTWAASIARAGGPAHNNAPSRGRVRPKEARDLARTYHGRVELVGTPTGRQYRTSTRTLNPSLTVAEYALPLEPDTGWAELEVGRMAAVAHSRLWVFGSHMFALDGAEPALVGEMQRRGVRLIMERRQGTTVAYEVEFPGEP